MKRLLKLSLAILAATLLFGCMKYEDVSESKYADTGVTKVYISLNGNDIPSPSGSYQKGIQIEIAPSGKSHSNVRMSYKSEKSNKGKYKDSIRGRGNTSWDSGLPNYPPKKPYNIKLDSKVALLKEKINGEPVDESKYGAMKAKRYCLLANYESPSLLNNKVAFLIGDALKMEWSPASEAVDLFIDGECYGAYQLTDHTKNLTTMLGIYTKEKDLTKDGKGAGEFGYLLELDTHYDDEPKFKSKAFNIPVMIKAPEEEDFEKAVEQNGEGYIYKLIEDDLNTIESEVNSGDYTHLDLDSFAKYWIVNNITNETDHEGPISVFAYRKQIGDNAEKLKIGPLWDYSYNTLTMKNDAITMNDTIYYAVLMKDTNFISVLKETWNDFYTESKLQSLFAAIDEEADYIRCSWELDAYMWDKTNTWGSEDFRTLDGYVNGIKKAIRYRCNVIDNYLKTI